MPTFTAPLGHDENSQKENTKNLEELFYKNIMPGNWDEVIKIYGENFELAHSVQINQLGDTALHFAISYGQDRIVDKLVNVICDKNKEVLKLENKKKNTPVHVAESMGTLKMCICIAKADPSLGIARNEDGETPLLGRASW